MSFLDKFQWKKNYVYGFVIDSKIQVLVSYDSAITFTKSSRLVIIGLTGSLAKMKYDPFDSPSRSI